MVGAVRSFGRKWFVKRPSTSFLAAVLWGILPFLLRADQSVSLVWDPSPGADVSGYILHFGGISGSYATNLDVGTNTTTFVTGLTEGTTNFFVVTAYNSQRIESEPSNEVSFVVPGIISLIKNDTGNMTQLAFPVAPGQSYEVQSTTNFLSWATIFQTTATTNCWVTWTDARASSLSSCFYRLHRLP